MALLAREPSARPDGLEVLARLDPENRRRQRQATSAPDAPQTVDPVLYGRADELSALHLAQARALAGRTTLVRVSGISGSKSPRSWKSF